MNMKKCPVFFLLLILLIFSPLSSYAASPVIGGDNAIETALEVSKSRDYDNVILVNQASYGDMASSVNLASKENASILFNPQEALLAENLEEIRRLNPTRVFIVGSLEAISDDVEAEIRLQGYETERFSGQTLYETNKKVLDYVFSDHKLIESAVVVNPEFPQDLAAIIAYVYQEDVPLILSDDYGMGLTGYPLLDLVHISFLIGGEEALSDNVAKRVPSPFRIAGEDWSQTSAMIQRLFFPEEGPLYVARDQDPAQVLVAVNLLDPGENICLVHQSVQEVRGRDKHSLTRLGKGVREGNGIAIYVNPHQDDETLTMGLQLIRDANEGKEIYLLQMTRGGSSSVRGPLNQKLEKEGFAPLDQEAFSKGRDNEVIGVLDVLGVPKEAFIPYDFQESLQSHMVRHALTDFTARFHDSEIELRTMATNPPGTNYDASAGGRDHRMCCEGVELFMEDPPLNGNTFQAKYFLGARTEKEIPGFIKRVASAEERPIYNQMIDQYNVWDPKNGRYRIGFLSVSSEFQIKRANQNMYEKE